MGLVISAIHYAHQRGIIHGDLKPSNILMTDDGQPRVKDIFIACIDGLKGFPEAIESVFSQTQVQLCIVHMVRNSVNGISVPLLIKNGISKALSAYYRTLESLTGGYHY